MHWLQRYNNARGLFLVVVFTQVLMLTLRTAIRILLKAIVLHLRRCSEAS
jgi:hypothetical protein